MSDKPTNAVTNAATGVLKVIHGSGEAIRGEINTLIDAAGEKIAGRKGSTPVTASGDRSVDVAERGKAEFREGWEAITGGRKSSGSGFAKTPRSSVGSMRSTTTAATAASPSSPTATGSSPRRVPPIPTLGQADKRAQVPQDHISPKTTQNVQTDADVASESHVAYDPDPRVLRDSDVHPGGAGLAPPPPMRDPNDSSTSIAESDMTTTTTRVIYGSLLGHGHGNEPHSESQPQAGPSGSKPATDSLVIGEDGASGSGSDSGTAKGKDAAMYMQSPTRLESFASGNTVYASAEDVTTAHATGGNPPALPPRSNA